MSGSDQSASAVEGDLVGALLARLEGRFGEVDDGAFSTSLITGGRSNLTYLVTYGDRRLVLRRPPSGHAGPRHDIGREYRVLVALEHTSVPVPAPHLFVGADEPGGPLFVMEYVEGRVLRDASVVPDMHDCDRLRLLGERLVDHLAEIHELDPLKIGLAELGHSEGYVERQVRRWTELQRNQPGRDLPALDEVARRLTSVIDSGVVDRAPDRPHLVHGDFNLANILVAPKNRFGPDDVVRAVLDWEMATLGHPLLDLGVLLAYSGPHGDEVLEVGELVSSLDGFPDERQLIDRYQSVTGCDVAALPFFQVLALFKLIVLTEDVRLRMMDAADAVNAGRAVVGSAAEALSHALLDMANCSGVPALDGRVRRRPA